MQNEVIKVGQVGIRFLLEGADTDGALAMFEFAVPVGAKVPVAHYHEHYDETVCGLEGVITFSVAGKEVDVGPGESCFIPRGVVHGFTNRKQLDAKSLAVVTPGVLSSDFFREAAAIVNAGAPPDPAKLKAVLAKHGLVAVAP